MKQNITHVAMDDSKPTNVAGIPRPGVQDPELPSIPNEPRHLRRLFERLKREGPVVACYEAGPSGYESHGAPHSPRFPRSARLVLTP
jgi:hypothetical protein